MKFDNMIGDTLGTWKNEKFNISIGHISPERWQEYRDLRLEALKEEPIAFQDPVIGKNKLLKLQEGEWRAMLDGRTHNGRTRKIVWCAEVGGVLVGMRTIEVFRILGELKINGENLFVKKEFRRKGIGRKLMEVMLAEIDKDEELKNLDIEINVYSTQLEAIELYKSLGFEIIKFIKDDKEYLGQKIDRYVMKRLKN